jgi:hypothetical protein
MDIASNRESIRQNLLDAGCDEAAAEQILCQLEGQELRDCLCRLSRHRRGLLEQVHCWERKIECLDYLVYELERKQKD